MAEEDSTHKDENKLHHRDPLWVNRFAILDKIDGDLFHRSKELSAEERRKVSFRFFAFLFAALWYFGRGLWNKGLFIVFCTTLFCIVVLDPLRFPDGLYIAITWGLPAIFCSCMATTDYYHKVKSNRKMWRIFDSVPEFITSVPVLLFLTVVTFAGSIVLDERRGVFLAECNDPEVREFVIELWNGYYTENPIHFLGESSILRQLDDIEQTKIGASYRCSTVGYPMQEQDSTSPVALNTFPMADRNISYEVNFTIRRNESGFMESWIELETE